MRWQLRSWHWIVIHLAIAVGLLLLWFGLAYGGLPRLWSRHEHKKIGSRDQITSYTAQDIPADPIDLHLIGTTDQIDCAFRKAGWTLADPVSVRSAVKIAVSVVLDHAYPDAPVSSLYVHDRVQDLAYEHDEGRSADKRHHVRFWKVGDHDWLAAATYDRGVGLSLYTLQITHHIGHEIDPERDAIGKLVVASGGRLVGRQWSRLPPGEWHRNGGGDRYRTDGMIDVLVLGSACR